MGIQRLGGDVDPYELPDEQQVELLAYIIHRRSPEGFLDSLAPMSARDQVHLNNWVARQKKPAGDQGTGDPELDSFNAMMSKEN